MFLFNISALKSILVDLKNKIKT